MADFRLPLSGVSTHKSVNPQKLTLTNTSSGTVVYDGSAAKSVDLAALTVSRASISNNGVFFVKGTQTASTNAWVGSLPQVSALYDGLTIAYYLPYAGTGTAATLQLTLANNVATAAEPVYYANNTRATTHYGQYSIIILTWISNATSGLAAVGSATGRWTKAQYNSDTYPSIYCSTGAGTAAKAGTCSGYKLLANSYAMMILTNANTAQSALTLNVNGQGAKPIYINGTASSTSNYTLPAGSYIIYYDGTNYHIRTDGILPGKILAASSADKAAQLTSARAIKIGNKSLDFNGSQGLTYTLSDIGAVAKAGDTMTGTLTFNNANIGIRRVGRSVNWIAGRTGALIATTSVSGYSPFASIKTTNGDWTIGAYDHSSYTDDLLFSFCTDANFNANPQVNATTAQIKFLENGHIVAALDGNASSASQAAQLTTARLINGTSFNGTSDITTAKWGTARTITLSDNSGSYTQANTNIDGSANFTLKLPATIKATLKGNADTATTATTAASFTNAKSITLTGDTTGSGSGGNGSNNWSIATTTKWLTAQSITTDSNIEITKTGAYTGSGDSFTGLSSMAYGPILHVGNSRIRTFELWSNGRGARAATGPSLRWRHTSSDDTNGNPWQAERIILDEVNYTNYTVTKTGGGATGTQWAISITGNAASASQVAWSGVTGKPDQATRWPKWNEIQQSGANSLTSGGSNWTDGTEILTSYASDNGFSDTNATGVVYRRTALCAYNYIKNKASGTWAISISGNSASATKLANARTIAISGGATGTATSFNGEQNITIPVTALDVSKATAGTLAIARGGTNITSYAKGDLLYASAANTLAKLAIGSNSYVLTVASGLPAWTNPTNITVGKATTLGSSALGAWNVPIYLANNGVPTATSMVYAGENMIPASYLTAYGDKVTATYDRRTSTYTLTVASDSTSADTAYLGLSILSSKVLIPWGSYFTLSCEIYSPVEAVWGYDENTSLETPTSGYGGNDYYSNHAGSASVVPANTWTKVWYQHANLKTPTSTAANNALPNKQGIYEYSYFGIKAASGNLKGQTFKIRNVQGFLGTNPNTEFRAAPEDGGRNGFLVLQGATSDTVGYQSNTRPNNPAIYFKNVNGSQNISLTFSDYDTVSAPASLTLAGNQGNEWFIAPKIKATAGFTGTLTGSATSLSIGTKGEARRPVYFVSGVPTEANYMVSHFGNAGQANMNDIGRLRGASVGMTQLSDPSNTTDNPQNGDTKSTGWHLYWDACYTDDPNGSNSWVAQIANKAGTNYWWVRSRSGGTITNGTAWASGWRHLVTSPQAGAGKSTLPIYINANGEPATISSYEGLAAKATADANGATIHNTYVKKVTSTNNAIVRFDGTGGAVKNSSVTINDSGSISAPASIYITKAGECGIEVNNTQATNPNQVAFIVGSSGNGGIYSRKHSKWIVYSDASGNVILNGKANTAGTADVASKLGSSTIGSTTKGIWLENGVAKAMTYELKATVNNATQWGVAYYSTTTNITSTAAGTAGYLLQSNATSAPSWIQATNANTASTIVKRDSSGNFSAGTITATLQGNAVGFINAKTITLTGDTTGSGSGGVGSNGWSVATVTKYITYLGRKTTAAAMRVNPSVDTGFKATIHISDSTSRTNDATNSPSFDAAIINLPWDWGGYNGQIALSNTMQGVRMQIRSASHTDNGESASPRYTPNYGSWREVVTATKATQIGSATQPVYVSNTGQVTACTTYANATVGIANKLSSNAGALYNPIYFADGKPVASKIYFKHYTNGTEDTNQTFTFIQRDFTKTITFNGTWQDLGIAGADLDSGTWIVQIYDDTRTEGALIRYLTYWSGVMSWYSGGTNGGGQYEEIILHAAGHSISSNHYHLRVIYPNTTATAKLQIKCSTSAAKTAANSLTLKFFKVL